MGTAPPLIDVPAVGTTARDRRPRRRIGVPPDLSLLLGAVLLFIAFSVWWLTQDDRVPDWDNGLHTLLAFGVHD